MLGPYQIVGLIGEGGMGAVYRAKDTRLGRDVAIKVLTNVAFSDRERLLRFEQEARATGMLNHPNLLTVYDVGRDDDGNPFLVTELLEGETLRSRLERGPLSPRKAVDAALQMALGTRGRAREGHRPSRPQARQHLPHARRPPEDPRLRHRQAHRHAPSPTARRSRWPRPSRAWSSARSATCRPSRCAARPSITAPTSSPSARSSTRCSPARARSSATPAIETLSAILKEEPPDLTELLPTIPPPLERLVRRCLEKDREHALPVRARPRVQPGDAGGDVGASTRSRAPRACR